MNNIRNSVTLIGHLGQNPQVYTTKRGGTLTSLSLATNDSYRNSKGDRITTTEWHRCIAFGKLAELVGNMCEKGKEVALRGKLTYNQYEDKNGIKRTSPQIVISEFMLISSKDR